MKWKLGLLFIVIIIMITGWKRLIEMGVRLTVIGGAHHALSITIKRLTDSN